MMLPSPTETKIRSGATHRRGEALHGSNLQGDQIAHLKNDWHCILIAAMPRPYQPRLGSRMILGQTGNASHSFQRIGKLRGMVRVMLKEELQEIDALVEKILRQP